MSAIEQPPQHARNILDGGKRDLRFDRRTLKERLGHADECGVRHEQAQPVFFDEVFGRRHFLLPKVVKRRFEEKLQVVVRAFVAVDDDL